LKNVKIKIKKDPTTEKLKKLYEANNINKMDSLVEKEISDIKEAMVDYDRFYEFYIKSKNLKEFKDNYPETFDEEMNKNIDGMITEFFETSLFSYIEEPLSFSKDFPFAMVQIVRIIENHKEKAKLKKRFFENIQKSIQVKFEYEFAEKRGLDIVKQIEMIKILLKDDLGDADIFFHNCVPEE
jgi:hypothetical protein